MTNRNITPFRTPFAGLIDSFFADSLPEAFPGAAAPASDITETADAFVLQFDLPGVRDQDLDVEVHERTLRVRAERKAQETTEGTRWHRRERRFGKVERTIVLPEGANLEAVDAKLEHGVLTISVPKIPEKKPTRVQIKSA